LRFEQWDTVFTPFYTSGDRRLIGKITDS